MRITGALLVTVLSVSGCSGADDTKKAADTEPASEEAALVLGQDALPMSITDSEYVELMAQLGFREDELTLWRVTAERHCEDLTTPGGYAGEIAVTPPTVYEADPVMITGLGVRRYCSDELGVYSEGAAAYQTVMKNLVGHCEIPLPERVMALGADYEKMTVAVCA